MNALLEKLFHEAAKLPEDQQEAFALRMLEELEEGKWNESFATSLDVLDKLAEKALASHRAGKTIEIDPDTMD